MTPAPAPAELRESLVTRLIEGGHLRTPETIAAFRATDRHLFLPHAGMQAAYAEDAVPTKQDANGQVISRISTPSVVAIQLEQLAAEPGHKVLEAGAATGYNASLLGRLVTPGGHVWTVDVDHDLVASAQKNARQAGASNVTAVLADGAAGLPEHAPFDRIQFTVGAADIPVKILDQLTTEGRLVIPMRVRGSISRSFAFERDDTAWKTTSTEMMTFVPMRKSLCNDVRTPVRMAGEGGIELETYSEQNVDRDAIRTALDQPGTRINTSVKFSMGSSYEWLYLYLAYVLPNGLSRLTGSRPGLSPNFSWGSMAAIDGENLAYLTKDEEHNDRGKHWRLGVIGHGPRATGLAEQVAAEIEQWHHGWGSEAPEPRFRMATGNARSQLTSADPRFVIDKPKSRLVLDWPQNR